MKISLLFYSGAGNTKFIAGKLSKVLKSRSHEVEITQVNSRTVNGFNQDVDLFIVGFPVYDITSPALIKQLVNNIKSTNKPIAYFNTKAFISGDSIFELVEISNAKGLKCVASQDFYMPATDALVLFAKKGSRTEKVLKYFHTRGINSKLEKFVDRIEEGKELKVTKKWYDVLSVLIPDSVKKSFHDQYTKYIPEFYSINDVCIECMLCVNGCPRENIRFEEGIKFDLNCDMCLSCIHHCPVDAIQIGNMTQGNVRLRKIEIND